MSSRMNSACANLELFLDGELDDAGANAFRRHLGVCDRCPTQLEATVLADELSLQVLDAASRPRTIEIPAPSPEPEQEPGQHPGGDPSVVRGTQRSPPDELARRRPGRRFILAVTSLAAVAAAAAVILTVVAGDPPPDLLATLGQQNHRAIEGRLAYPGLDQYRPLARERGGLGGRQWPSRREQTLAALEERGDQHGLAMALLLDGRPQQAAAQLVHAGANVSVWSDQAAVAIERGDARTALQLTDRVLAVRPDHRQALWNRAVALQLLGQSSPAAEPGWAEEAARRAAQLRTGDAPPLAIPAAVNE
jgi:hypothetical protein